MAYYIKILAKNGYDATYLSVREVEFYNKDQKIQNSCEFVTSFRGSEYASKMTDSNIDLFWGSDANKATNQSLIFKSGELVTKIILYNAEPTIVARSIKDAELYTMQADATPSFDSDKWQLVKTIILPMSLDAQTIVIESINIVTKNQSSQGGC